MHGVQAADIDSAEDLNDAEADKALDSGDSFVHVHNIEKSGINVNACSVYVIFQIAWVLTDNERFVIFGDMELLGMYAQCFNTEL